MGRTVKIEPEIRLKPRVFTNCWMIVMYKNTEAIEWETFSDYNSAKLYADKALKELNATSYSIQKTKKD